MLTVHLRVNDAATGRPTPVRLRVSAADGTAFAPLGRVAEFPHGRNEDVGGHLLAGRDRWYYTDGACEITLPAGVPLRVQATKGPEYRPLDETVTLGPGQMALRFAVERWTDRRADGWFAGDTRAHFLTPHSALLEAAAEDLAVVNLLAAVAPLPTLGGKEYFTVPNVTAFSGQTAALEADGRQVVVNTLNAHPSLGRVGLLHSHRPVFPLTSGGDDPDDWSLCDWCDQCHRKGGLTVWADAFRPESGVLGGEALVALILGKIDAVECDARPHPRPIVALWYHLWNAGFRVPLVGGSGKGDNRTPLGSPRTYARLPAGEPYSYRGWVEAVRAGRTFTTTGPLLSVDAAAGGSCAVTVTASAESVFPFDRLEVVVNGQVAATAAAARGPVARAGLTADVVLPGGGWVAARCWGPLGTPLDPAARVFAHTSPVAVPPAGPPEPPAPAAVAFLRDAVRQTREWVADHGRFANQKRKDERLALCDAALARLGG